MLEFIESIDDAIENIKTLRSYLDGSKEEQEFALDTIKNGRCFVIFKAENRLFFAPSRFTGYKNNDISHGLKRPERSGSKTNDIFESLLGKSIKKDDEQFNAIENAFAQFCKKLNINPCAHEKKYWLINFKSTLDLYYDQLNNEVIKSRNLDSKSRKERLEKAPKKPEVIETTTQYFKRNPDVIAEVLERANGFCEKCKKEAPFISSSTEKPYLEVHHKTWLSKDGDDTVENAIALCPNCHREEHFGKK